MGLKAGELRDLVAFKRKVPTTQDPNSGEQLYAWDIVPGLASEPAKIESLSVRELIAAQQSMSKVTARIKIRYRAGLDASMRIDDLVTGEIYNIEGLLPDLGSRREYLTIPVSQGTNNG